MRKSRKKTPHKAVTFTIKDKLMAFGIPCGFFALIVGVMIFGSIQKHSAALDVKLLRWSERYHLDEQQMSAIRNIELRFHGNGNPLSVGSNHSPAEIREHHISISRVMSPADGVKFLEAMERSGGNH